MIYALTVVCSLSQYNNDIMPFQKGVTPLFLHYCDYPNFYFIMTVVVVLMHKINIAIEAFAAIISSFCIYPYIQ